MDDKHSVVKMVSDLGIPKKLMTYIANPACDECVLFQSLKITCNVLNYAAADGPQLLKSFLEWGLLPCLYAIMRSHRDVNVIQHVILCLARMIKIDGSLRESILVENGMLKAMLEVSATVV